MSEAKQALYAGIALAVLCALAVLLPGQAAAHECPKYYDPEPTSPPGQDEVPRKGSMPFAHAEVGAKDGWLAECRERFGAAAYIVESPGRSGTILHPCRLAKHEVITVTLLEGKDPEYHFGKDTDRVHRYGEEAVGADVRVPPLGPGLTNVLGVHYSTRLTEAEKHFLDAGFQDIRDIRYADLPQDDRRLDARGNRASCNALRVWVRGEDRAGRATSFYQGDTELFDSPVQCNAYRFSAARYIGPQGDLGRAWE